MGDKVEVLEPEELREKMKEEIEKTEKRYKK
jgi:predicted DNA-binding transcriptional regulator YafY